MRGRQLLLVCLGAVAIATVPHASARNSRAVVPYRALHLLHLAPGVRCPVSRPDSTVGFARFGITRGLGSGPAYPIGMSRGVLFLAPAAGADAGSPWAGQKVLWFVHPRYDGPVLVRGRRLDGPGLVRFDRGTLPAAELRIAAGTRERPSFTRLRSAGCYGYQIDGTSFSRIVVFRATGIP